MKGKSPTGYFLFIALLSCVFLSMNYRASSQNRKFSFLPNHNRNLKYCYGLPGVEWENPKQEAAKKFDFSYYRIGGCVMPEELRKHAGKHNSKLENRLTKKYGVTWKENYHKEVDRLNTLFRYADTLLMRIQSFWDQYPIIPDGKIPFNYYQETRTDSVLLLSVCDVDAWTNNNQLVILKQFELNLVSKTVILSAIKPDGETITVVTH
jgi:hypothetical protein